ncbi:hypothetical protein LCGC14_0811650 [marine sediment metagenome]|uniref:ParB-like N-terminal domain-containing protein n=1 Tax=marine sediment metagenome TaxID=412755 RepID=A0A0F9Q6P8_9ZZZZ
MSLTPKTKSSFRQVDLGLIDPPEDPDRISIDPDTINELADSIREVGLLQPILVTKKGDRFLVVFGHRRFLACQKLGLGKVTAGVVDYSDVDISIARATENIQRDGLTPIEEAKIYVRMTDQLGLSLEQAGKRTGKSAGVVKRRIDLLRMPTKLQRALHGKKVSISVAEELWKCPDEPYRDYLIEMATEHGVTQMVARNWVEERKKEMRGKEYGTEGGGGGASLMEPTPVFVACDTCKGPEDVTGIKYLRVCKKCMQTIMANLGQ